MRLLQTPSETDDHFLGLEHAQLVGTEALLTTRDNVEAVIEAKAMMCVYGPAGSGKTMSINSALRHLAPENTYRLKLRAGPTPRDIRHGLFEALGLPGEPPNRPIEFDNLLKDALAEEFRILVCDEAQWMKKTSPGLLTRTREALWPVPFRARPTIWPVPRSPSFLCPDIPPCSLLRRGREGWSQDIGRRTGGYRRCRVRCRERTGSDDCRG
ncbi:hypothetical protein DEJ50_33520 [Streptomyces venezuelae]|uniref:ORC1/DEAH AAA+ ATPase domain-containing protein n=1 Tax=Streptomyces venezuelae TaxID=54571 RepID=A0A5P2DCN6_STRVZ|nr:hypothetical protein DEJ50_33520 [Streptomyces venezuelae]